MSSDSSRLVQIRSEDPKPRGYQMSQLQIRISMQIKVEKIRCSLTDVWFQTDAGLNAIDGVK